MARSGGFNPSLDPFGTSRGGLGRYNVSGDSISSLAQTEAYAVAVAWSNGAATDEAYIASLQKLVDLEQPGTSGYITAKNKIDDAVYSIGRNKVVDRINSAATPAARQEALRGLLAYDKAHLDSMTATDSQAYRTQQERVTSTRVDLRQARYSELVDKVNRGKATTAQLYDLARTLKGEAGADPDSDDWQNAITDLRERVADEKLSDGFQSYQHHHKSGASLLAEIDGRLAQLTPGSPAWKTLHNQREDLADRVKSEAQAIDDAKTAGLRASGKMSDAAYIEKRRKAYAEAQPGTTEWIMAGNQLRDATFSLAEDKLRYDVGHGKKPVSALISFYQSYQHGMNSGSERWRQVQNAIDSLRGRGGSGGAGGGGGGGGGGRSGGGGGSSSKGGIALGPKILGGPSVMSDFLGGATGAKPPKDFAGLFSIDVTSVASRHWWDNNLQSMSQAFRDGSGTWTYYDKSGGEHQLAFVPSLMGEMDAINLNYARRGLATAHSAKEAQTWVGRIRTAVNGGQSRGAAYAMDVYTSVFGDLEKAKQRALAGGRFGEYHNLVMQQASLAASIMGNADGVPDARSATNPYLTADQKARIERDLAKIAPMNNDDSPANAGNYNPTGDPVLAAIRDGIIQTDVDPDTGEVIGATLDPNRGYLSQTSPKDGHIVLITFDQATNPEAFVEQIDPNSPTGDMKLVPRYLTENVRMKVRIDGQDVEVYQPIAAGDASGASAPVYVIDRASAGGLGASSGGGLLGTAGVSDRAAHPASYRGLQVATTGARAEVKLLTTYTVEHTSSGTIGTTQSVRWVSTDGQTWFRWPQGSLVPPRIVVDPRVTTDADGKWLIDGKSATNADVLALSHMWSGMDALAAGARDDKEWGIGAPNTKFEMRRTTYDANGQPTIDGRPQYMIDSEENDAIYRAARRLNRKEPDTPLPSSSGLDEGRFGQPAAERFGPPAPPSVLMGLNDERGGRVGARRPSTFSPSAPASGELLPTWMRTKDDTRDLAPASATLLGVKPPPTLNVAKVGVSSLSGLGGLAAPMKAPVSKLVAKVAPIKLTPIAKQKDDVYTPPKSGGGPKTAHKPGAKKVAPKQKDDVYTPPPVKEVTTHKTVGGGYQS